MIASDGGWRVQREAQPFDPAVGREAGGVSCQVWMALAGQRHVQLARQPNAHGPPRLPCTERRDRGPRVGLHFLAAERTAHPETFDGDLVPRQSQHARHDFLRFGWMLGGRVHRDAAGFVQPGDRRLRLEIEMLLATDDEFAFEAERAPLDHRHVAAGEAQRVGQKAAGVDRLLDAENRRKRFVGGDDAVRAALRVVQRVGEHPRDRLAMKHDLAREQRFVVAARSAVAFACHIGRGERGDDARLLECRCHVER
jgi:hypothetical protein